MDQRQLKLQNALNPCKLTIILMLKYVQPYTIGVWGCVDTRFNHLLLSETTVDADQVVMG